MSHLARLFLVAAVVALSAAVRVGASPVAPATHKAVFESAKKEAEVVADVRVLPVVCSAAEGNNMTPQVATNVLEVEKRAVKKNQVVLVARQVSLPAGLGPLAYGLQGAVQQFPFTPGVKGSVALRWDKEACEWVGIAGWVPEPDGEERPKEVGIAFNAEPKP